MTENETFLYLTTIGRVTGNPHTIEIWYVEYEGAFYLCAEGRENAHWVRNLRVQPSVTFFVATRDERPNAIATPGVARPLTEDDPQHAPVAALFQQKYNWNEGLLVEIKVR